MIRSYRDLEVWQMAMALAEEVYRLTELLPRQETYGLAAQMQRAAISVPSNLAEGHARSSTREYARFVSIALGSLAELETQIMLAHRLHALPDDRIESLMQRADETGRKLRGLQKSLDDKLAASQRVAPQPPVPSPQPRSSQSRGKTAGA